MKEKKMNKNSTKRIFCYFSLSFVFAYVVFVLLMYNAGLLPQLYDIKETGIHYIVIYSLLATVCYAIDTQTKKQPGLLMCLCLPIHSLTFLVLMMLLGAVKPILIVLTVAIFLGILAFGYYTYTKWIKKILLVKKAYENALLAYGIVHLFMVLFVAFKVMGLL